MLKSGQAALHCFGQFYPAEMNVEHGGLQRGVAGIERDLVQVHARSRHMGQTQVAWGVGGKAGQVGTTRNLLNGLGPHDQRKGMSPIAMRLRQKQGPG